MNNPITIPKVLLPVIPPDPRVCKPVWFTERPRLHKLKTKNAITLDTLVWRDYNGWFWTCPKGFLTDGASIPFLLRWLWSRWDLKTLRPAIIHDLRYCLHDYFDDWDDHDRRTAADDSLYDGMMIDCPKRADCYHFACAMFGRAVYEHINKEEIMQEWFDILREDNELKLNKWIQARIDMDRAA